MKNRRPLDILSPEFAGLAELQALAGRIADDLTKTPRQRKGRKLKPTSQRARALTIIRAAAYHDDEREALRARIEARIGHAAYVEAMEAGRRLRARGVPCGCFECERQRAEQGSST